MPLPQDGRIDAHPDAPSALWSRRVEITGTDTPRDPQYCGAVLIAPDWALTARHCVDHKRWFDLVYAAGTRIVGAPGYGAFRRGVAAFCPLDAVPGQLGDDVALVRLDQPMPAAAPILPLADMAGMLARDPRALSRLGSWRWADAGRLRAPITISPMTLRPDRRNGFLVGTRVFTHKPGPCGGESGSAVIGPIGLTPHVIGILSAVFDPKSPGGAAAAVCSRAGARALFTPVAPHRDWISGTMAACDADLSACLSRELTSPPQE